MMLDPVDLAMRLIACPSVTPADAGAQDVLADVLAAQGFAVDRFAAGDPPIANLIATRGGGDGPYCAFAGHTDVVPPGGGWTGDPFGPEVRGSLLYGRGAVDMKGAIAAFVAACDRLHGHRGTIGLLITGDEEGAATHGTRAIIERMQARGDRPDMILVGEPTCVARLGDMAKIGRRGSVNAWIRVAGTQGHVAYPHLADNPVPVLVRILAALEAWTIDAGNDWFQPSNLEITDIHIGNPAHNVIPAHAEARINIRFNDAQTGAGLVAAIERIAAAESARASVEAAVSGEAFLTVPGPLSDLVGDAVEGVTGMRPALSTTGGTSDARFLSRIAPTIEFGLVNATMHKTDEAAAVDDIRALADIYERIVRAALT